MAVVAGRRAEELDLVELVPGGVAAQARGVGVADAVEHHVEARRVAHVHVLEGHLEHLGEQAPRGGDALRVAVVARVDALVVEVARRGQDVEHGLGELDLLGAGLAAGHVEGQVQGAQARDLVLQAADSPRPVPRRPSARSGSSRIPPTCVAQSSKFEMLPSAAAPQARAARRETSPKPCGPFAAAAPPGDAESGRIRGMGPTRADGGRMERMDYEQIREMLVGCCERIIRCEPYLSKVDSAIGDGDHGTGMMVGSKAALRVLEEGRGGDDVFALYARMGQAMQDAMGGASGIDLLDPLRRRHGRPRAGRRALLRRPPRGDGGRPRRNQARRRRRARRQDDGGRPPARRRGDARARGRGLRRDAGRRPRRRGGGRRGHEGPGGQVRALPQPRRARDRLPGRRRHEHLAHLPADGRLRQRPRDARPGPGGAALHGRRAAGRPAQVEEDHQRPR